MKEIIYYERDENKRPILTVCLVVNKCKIVLSRGVAKCSKKDMPVKKIGRAIATGRARRAAKWENVEPNYSPWIYNKDTWKAVFVPTLTPYEETLIAKSV